MAGILRCTAQIPQPNARVGLERYIMSFFDNGFDADKVEPNSGGFDPIPAGEYRAVIMSSQEKPTRKDGKQLSVQFQIDGGKYNNRKVFYNINLVCKSSAKAEEIGHGQLSALLRAVNTPRPRHAAEIVGKACLLNLSVVPDDYNGGMKNEVRGVKPIKPDGAKEDRGPAVDAPDWQ